MKKKVKVALDAEKEGQDWDSKRDRLNELGINCPLARLDYWTADASKEEEYGEKQIKVLKIKNK